MPALSKQPDPFKEFVLCPGVIPPTKNPIADLLEGGREWEKYLKEMEALTISTEPFCGESNVDENS